MSALIGRTGRDLSLNFLSRRDVARLLEMIRGNHKDTRVLKIKEHVSSDISPLLLEYIIHALEENTVCVSRCRKLLFNRNMITLASLSCSINSFLAILYLHILTIFCAFKYYNGDLASTLCSEFVISIW